MLTLKARGSSNHLVEDPVDEKDLGLEGWEADSLDA